MNYTQVPATSTVHSRCAICQTLIPVGAIHFCAGSVPLSNLPLPTFAPQPWTCPKCGRVWGPNTLGCDPCNASVVSPLSTPDPSTVRTPGEG